MTVRFSDTDLDRLRSYADANGLDVAKAIREVVTTFLTMVENKNTQPPSTPVTS
jgi:predicted DNA binding CopG/RHH family protein